MMKNGPRLQLFWFGEGLAGGKLKETKTRHWLDPNEGATNETGFTALPAGFRFYEGSFKNVGKSGYWWSSEESSANSAWYHSMNNLFINVYRGFSSKKDGYSVRCLQD